MKDLYIYKSKDKSLGFDLISDLASPLQNKSNQRGKLGLFKKKKFRLSNKDSSVSSNSSSNTPVSKANANKIIENSSKKKQKQGF